MGRFQFAGIKLDVAESTIFNSLIRSINIFLRLLAEMDTSDGFFPFEPLFQGLIAFDLSFQSGRDNPYRGHDVESV